ncbi:exodeoxyribonuclease VII large subunit [Sphingomonas sp. MAH-20]|uniref:Exodeoxyribonuclease 7 large subunit n=1 Tax=Sphingomonas horti TaxID=2682842 RepID=A0A6I4J533_9SPHN|nr:MULTISPECIES: exodeoxyribonuclease VII large subunit [Sphingomonas]MBA2919190.1 exodeoxyribonuclease VII large subunit [Sphingomonas sp. CGMCC 1.13658]MVO79223.1 exodeoxyribonuclease VII large subunit [Sphingomonas horti]
MASEFPGANGNLVAAQAPGDNAPALSVSELAFALKRVVEDSFGMVRLRGEISGYKRAASGHAYLTLKDDKACIDAVMWKTGVGALPFRPEDGIEVIATGKLTTYPGRSKYQIVIERLELAGEGALMLLLEKLKAKLGAEGLFDAGAKKKLPFLPRRIGVVTSPTGAVIRDILHRLEDRCPTHVTVWPVMVQGQGAAEQVAAAIAGFCRMPDGQRPELVIVARGGGSIEDLWAFNEEVVVRAVAACTIPIISAVGHETDTTLCDYAADVRAPTPTAAAEMAVPVRAELRAYVRDQGTRMERCARRYHERAGERLHALTRLLPTPASLLDPQRQRVDDYGERLRRGLGRRVADARGELARASGALRPTLLRTRLDRCADRLAAVWRLAQSVNPENLLARGYAWVEGRGGQVVTSAAQARSAVALSLHFADGNVDARVERATSGGKREAPPPSQPSLL